jgi:hypothetical protein
MTTVTVTNFTLLDPRLLVIERNTQLGGSLQTTRQWPTLLSDPDYVIATFQAANENVLTPFDILDPTRNQTKMAAVWNA